MIRNRATEPRHALAGAVLFVIAAAAPIAAPGQTEQGGGISQEEYLRVFPPAPAGVRAEVIDGNVIIFWERPAPPAPGAQTSYDPEIEMYRIYSLGPGLERRLIGETAGTWFIDKDVPAGAVRRYGVSAVQRSGQESGVSTDVKVRAP